MNEYKVTVALAESSSDMAQTARSPIEAAFYAGIAVGAGVIARDPSAPLMARVLGVGAIQQEVIEATAAKLTSVLVEEL